MRKLPIRIARYTESHEPKGYSPFARCRSSELEMTCMILVIRVPVRRGRRGLKLKDGWSALPEVAAEEAPNPRQATHREPSHTLRGNLFHRTSPPLFSSVGLDGLGSRDAAVPWMPSYAPPTAIMTPAAPWSVPWLPFSEIRRPNSENCSISVSLRRPWF